MKHTKKILGVAALLLLVGAMLFVYITFREKPEVGTKQIMIEVTVDTDTHSYCLQTDADYLLQAMEQTEDLTFEMADGMVHTVNGLRADYVLDGAYWGFFVNGDYCNYGIAEQPVADGDIFAIVYTPA